MLGHTEREVAIEQFVETNFLKQISKNFFFDFIFWVALNKKGPWKLFRRVQRFRVKNFQSLKKRGFQNFHHDIQSPEKKTPKNQVTIYFFYNKHLVYVFYAPTGATISLVITLYLCKRL